MITFNEYIESKKPKFFLENKLLDDIIDELRQNYQDLDKQAKKMALSGVIYNYIAFHADNHEIANNLYYNDRAKYNQESTQYKDFTKKVIDAIKSNGYKLQGNDYDAPWLQLNRVGNNSKAKKEDGTKTTKRYISIDLNDLYKAYARLPTLAKELNKVVLKPDFDYLSFKFSGNYHMAIGHKDNIVIHFYDKMAKDQVDQAVQNFLNAAGVKESDRAKVGRVNFGTDDKINGERLSDSMIVAKSIADNLADRKAGIPAMLKRPDLKKHLQTVIDGISMQSSHRS